jgi:hypothetical protein
VGSKQLDSLRDRDELLDANTVIDLIEANLTLWDEEENNPELRLSTELT